MDRICLIGFVLHRQIDVIFRFVCMSLQIEKDSPHEVKTHRRRNTKKKTRAHDLVDITARCNYIIFDILFIIPLPVASLSN